MLRCIQQNPSISQRELASQLGISLGKSNYCVKALMNKGWVKAKNFKNSDNKRAYRYVLTPQGLEQKAKLSYRFLKRKEREYKLLHEEIAQLTAELEHSER